MLVVKIGEDITVGRGLRRACGGDQATQNIFRDGALAMTLRWFPKQRTRQPCPLFPWKR